jgi:hypothetical protein
MVELMMLIPTNHTVFISHLWYISILHTINYSSIRAPWMCFEAHGMVTVFLKLRDFWTSPQIQAVTAGAN